MDYLNFHYTEKQSRLFVIFLLIYEIAAYISNDMIMPAMLKVAHSFNAPISLISTSLTVFMLGGASLQIFLGPLSDRFGRRPLMLFGIAFFLLSTFFMGISASMNAFIWGRFFQGMGLCFISVIGYATLHELYVEVHAVRLASIMSSITILAPLLGPLLGALVLLSFSWRAIFFIISTLACIAFIGLWFYMPETVNVKKKDNSYTLITPLRLNIIKNNYLALIKNKYFMWGAVSIGISNTPLIAWIGLSPIILMKTAHLTVIEYAMWQLPVFGAVILGNVAMRAASHHIALPQLTFIGSILLGSSLILTGLLSSLFSHHYIWIIFGLIGYEVGQGFLTGPLIRLTLFSTSISKATASALMSFISMVIGGIGNELAGWLYGTQNNFYFSLFCASCGIIYFLFYYGLHKINASSNRKEYFKSIIHYKRYK